MTQPAVIVRLMGGLGNQLFQYAFGRALALRNGVPLCLDSLSGFPRDPYRRQFELDGFPIAKHCEPVSALVRLPLSRWRRQWWHAVAACKPLARRHYVRERSLTTWDPDVANTRIRRPTYFDGYWQHEEYFRDARQQLLHDLTIAPAIGRKAAAIAEGIDRHRAVCIHVRCLRRNAAGNHDDPRLDIDAGYYERAVDMVRQRIDSPSFVVFSDHPSWVQAQRLLPPSGEFLQNDGSRTVHEDIWLMSQFRNFIVGNSTFSWWGAWLSQSEDKYVVAPRSGFNHGIHSVPPEWKLA